MSDIQSLVKDGQIALNLGNPKEALVLYEKVLQQEPYQIEALLKKGHILGKLARFEQAIICYDLVISQESGNLLAFLNKGLAHHYLAQYDNALSCYEQVLSVKPQNTTALYNKASSLIKSGNVPDGLEILSQVIKLDFSFKAKAKFDLDFEEIKKLNEFRKITM